MRDVTRGLCLVLLAATAAAGGLSLKQLLDPAHEDFPLRPYSWEEWEGLDKATQLRAVGTDPEEWADPPPDPEADKEAEEKRKRAEAQGAAKYPQHKWPGYRFDARLEKKKAAFEEMIQPASASKLEGLVKQLDLLDKSLAKYDRTIDEVREKYQQVAEQYSKASSVYAENYRKKHGTWPEVVSLPAGLIRDHDAASRRLQEVMAVRQSEERFHDWLLLRLATLLGELSEEERAKPVAALAKGIADKDWVYRIRCARLLGQLGDAASVAAYRSAMEKEEDPLVLAELIRIRAKRGGEGILDLLRERLQSPQWPVRATAIRALAELASREALDLLVERMPKEDGRLLDDIAEVLRRLTGQDLAPEPDPWRIWWEKNRAAWAPPAERKEGEAASAAAKEGTVYFYGIRTSSKRIVFCVDVSGSMDFPLDGANGKEPPRIETAKRELGRALASLPEEAQFNVVVYNAEVKVWKKRMQPATLANKQAARKYVERLEPSGATNIFDALLTSMEVAAPEGRGSEEPEADTIYFLTDGQPTHGRIIDPNQILEEITDRNQLLGIVIHTVGVSKEQNAGFLLNLAKRNRGRYVGVK